MGKLWGICAIAVMAMACGGSTGRGVESDAGPSDSADAAAATDAGPPDAEPSVCGDGLVTGIETCDDAIGGDCCTGCQLIAFGNECRASAGECDAAEACDGLMPDCPADEVVPDGTACSIGFCSNGACVSCDDTIDADFDGSNQCLDCDDNNALVLPGQPETCDGVDEDCDGDIDEDFDGDLDGFSVCSTDPFLFDCDDTRASVNPGATEDCGATGAGNGLDDNCNGFIDETCQPCDATDDDGDGLSECDGDCDDTTAAVAPNLPEACDGLDTDCNTFTVKNCDVSDACNFPGDPDVCLDDLVCGCVVGANGACNGDFRCTSFCQGSYTGPIGAGCTDTQTCLFRVTLSDNQHGCAETTATLGNLLAGEACGSDAECRSGSCDTLCVGPGCNTRRCVDFCDHHEPDAAGSCATGTVCEIVSTSFMGAFMFARCGIDNNGTGLTGDDCGGGCAFGSQSCVNNVCSEPCGQDSHCPVGFHCSLLGNQVQVGTWGAGDVPAAIVGEPAIETVPVCLANTGPGDHDRPGGAACDQNSDCLSEFCEATLGVCIDLCVTDSSCAPGLACEPVFMRTPPGDGNGAVFARACTNASVGDFLESQ